MTDYAELAAYLAMDYRESRDQIDALERAGKWPAEEIQKRRARLKIKGRAVHVVRVVADSAAIQELVEQQLQLRGRA